MGRGGICPDSSPSAFLSPCLDVHLQMQLPVKPFSIFHVNSTSHSNFKGCQTTGEAAGHVALQPRSTRVGSAAQRFLQRTSPRSLPLYEGTFVWNYSVNKYAFKHEFSPNLGLCHIHKCKCKITMIMF